MKRWSWAAILLVLAVAVGGIAVYWFHVRSVEQVEHETNRWAVIEDIDKDRIAVEPTSNVTWSELLKLYQDGTRMWIGGIVEKYDNKCGFRFKPDTIIIAQFTAEGLQATIKLISSNIDYWTNLGYAYVGAKVIETHSES
jgi:hypothetical protein